MAVVVGQSQAWKEVLKQIGRDLPGCSSPSALSAEIAKLQSAESTWLAEATDEVQQRKVELEHQEPLLRSQFESAVAAAKQKVRPAFEQTQAEIAHCQAAWFALRWYYRWKKIPQLRSDLERLRAELARLTAHERRALAATHAELLQLESDPMGAISMRIKQKRQRLDRLRAAAASPEHAGAVAELHMAAILRALPDAYTVINDVSVETGRWMRDGKDHRKSAQIDHVVVGPTGVFVIEDKRWSANFAVNGHYYDPFEQVKWASKLCYRLLSGIIGSRLKVRQIIATSGSLPSKPPDSYAKVLAPERVCGYIQWFQPILDDGDIRTVVSVLQRLCPVS